MGRFFIPVFLSFVLAALCLLFPPLLAAQNSFDWALPGDKIEETGGRGLVVRSVPSGARVYIDGIERGRTPLFLENLRAGQYFVQVQKEGYSERRFRVSVRTGSVMDVTVELKEALGRLLLKIQAAPGSPDGASLPLVPRISVDGRSYPSPALELPVGFRTILVRAFGWEDASVTTYVAEDTFGELELNLKPAAFKLSGAKLSRVRFSPANAGSLGTTVFSFEVSVPGRGSFSVLDPEGSTVLVRSLGPFETWSQSVSWDGRDRQGEILGDGIYTLIVTAFPGPGDDTPPVGDTLALNVELDSTKAIHPLDLSSGKSGLLFAPLPALLPAGSFQIEGSLLAGSPPGSDSGSAWTSLPFAAAFRFSPVERLEVSGALNVIPRIAGDTPAGIAGGVKWLALNARENSAPLGAAAGAVVAWTGQTGLTPFGMASGIELFFPLDLKMGTIFSFTLTPAALWTGDEGFPWGPVPRLLVSGGFMAQMTYVGAGLSIRSEYDFTRSSPWPPNIIAGAEIKIFPPPSSFVLSFMGGIWIRDNALGGFGGIGIGMIY